MRSDTQDNVSYLKSLFKSGENTEVSQRKMADFFSDFMYLYNTVNKKITEILGYTDHDKKQWDNFVFKDDIVLVQIDITRLSSLKIVIAIIIFPGTFVLTRAKMVPSSSGCLN